MKACISAIALFLSVCLNAQNDQVLMTVDGKPVYRSEFEAIYKKNNKEPRITRESLDEYLDLFVKFKLKVTEAEQLGFDTIASFRSELDGYRKQLAKPYLTDNELTDELLREAYERMKWEVEASHILIRIGGAGTPDDTLKAFRKAQDIRKRIMAGESFGKLAAEFSEDPSAKQNMGNLGYFTGLMMVYPFETAAFTTQPGQVSEPVRTSFGYHIIKVTNKRPARGEVKVAHILLQSQGTDTPEKKQRVKEKIDELHKLAVQGDDFASLARKFSEDKTSAESGGVLPVFGTGKMVENFEEIAFALQNPGDVSQPFMTDYGWHIVKLLEKKPVGSFDQLKPTLVRRISRDDRSKMTRQSFINRLRKEYNFTEFRANLKPFQSWVDTSIFSGNWKMPAIRKAKPLFTFNGKTFTQEDFAAFLDSKQRKAPVEELNYFIETMYSQFVEKSIMDFEENNLENKYPEFKALVKEYRDGILLFDLTNKMVWNKAVIDSTGLKAFYGEHRNDFMWKKRADAVLYKAKDKKIADNTRKLVKKGISREDILKQINTDSQLNLTAEALVAETGTNALLDKFEWKKGLSDVQVIDGQYVFADIRYVMEEQPKRLEEARGAVTAAYQNFLEEQWLKSLREKYKVEINKDVLYSVQ